MRKLLSLLVLVLIAAVAAPALAKGGTCDAGDEAVGPNCVHVTWVKLPILERPFSKVYRVDDKGQKTVVWHSQGFILKSTAKYLVVQEWVAEGKYGQGDYDFLYSWDNQEREYNDRVRCSDDDRRCKV